MNKVKIYINKKTNPDLILNISRKLDDIMGLRDLKIDLENKSFEFSYKRVDVLNKVFTILEKFGCKLRDSQSYLTHNHESEMDCLIRRHVVLKF